MIDSPKPKKIMLVGCGTWGQNILRDLVKLGCDITVVDPDALLLDQIKSLGAKEILVEMPKVNNCDGVIIAAPTSRHYEVLQQVIPWQVPTLVEKPITDNLKDAVALLNMVHDDVFPMHVWQYHPGIRLLKDIILSKELGSVISIRSTRANWASPRLDVDTLWNLVPHDLSIIEMLLGHIPKLEYVMAERYAGIVRGALICFGSDPVVSIDVSNRYPQKVRELRLHCSKGVALWSSHNDNYIEIVRDDANPLFSATNIEKRFFDKKPPLTIQLERFVKYLGGDDRPIERFQDGYNIIQSLDSINAMLL